jgi:hypothetical protein
MESEWTPETSKINFRGQNSMAYGVFYIIGKLLERRCLKWLSLLIHTSETQVMAKRRAGSQIGSLTPDQKKVRNRPDLLICRTRATYRWKPLDKSYNFSLERISIRDNFASDHISIRGMFAKLWDSKVARVFTGAISGLPLGSLGKEKPFRCRLRG